MRGPRSAAGRSRRKCRRKFFSDHSKETSPRSLEDFVRSLRPGECQGGDWHERKPGSTRITFQNVNGIPANPTLLKQEQLSKWLQDEKVGIALFAETNCHWPSLREGTTWRDRLRKISPGGYYTATAYNRHQDRTGASSSFQWGGTAVAAFGKASHAAREYGSDPSGLGRWSFIRLRGKLKQKMEAENGLQVDRSQDLVIISAYRPNPLGGVDTVCVQHQLYFDKIGRRSDPRSAFTRDLCKAINVWRDEGCEIILGVDANEDVSVWSPTSFRNRMKEAGLSEAILRLHPKRVATFHLNTKDEPIDGIFVSSGVHVLSAGYLAFDEGFHSDHRGLWMDIDLAQSLGGHKPERASFSPRQLSTQDSRSVARYLKIVEREYIRLSIPQRLQQLEEKLQANNNRFTPITQKLFNTIHQQAYAIRRAAESKCRKRSMGKVPWSPLIQGYWDRILLLRLLIKGHQGCRVSSRKVRRLIKKTGLEEVWRLSVAELQIKLREERAEYKEMKRTKAHDWRRAHIDSRLRAAKSLRHTSKKARNHFLRLQRMKQREEARRRRCARGKGFSGGLKAIQIPRPGSSSEDDLLTITDRHLVEQGCMDENRARYDQTRFPYPTPPMQEPLYSMFNGDPAERNSQDLLHGSLDISAGVDKYTLAFLDQCRFHKGFRPQHLEVSTAVHTDFWRKMDESRGSEPHGLHNGHFKAGCQSPLVAYCDAIVRNLPFQSGMVPDQWKNLMNFAIEKKAGDFRLSKMRTIQMMNSEFQANNKLVGKQSMAFAEKHNLIPPGQCGSRKQHQSIDLALSKRLVWDLLILQRRAAGWISNDAKSCFDRVVHSIAKIALLRFGILWTALSMMFDTLALSTHRVRTGFGDSDDSFEPPSDVAFQGCGQGNGAGPPIWAAVSSILILMMEAAGFGFECLSALSRRLITAQCFAFVDDTDAIEAAKDVNSSLEDIFPDIQAAAKLWSGGIQATGGAINPDKSFCWLLDFEWCASTGVWKFRKILPTTTNGLQLQIYGLSRQLEPLQHLQPHQSERTLGVMLAPLEDHHAQLQFVLTKAKEWIEELRPQFLKRYDVFPILKTTILKSLEYPSALSTLSYDQSSVVMKPILKVCLPKAGVCRNFPREMVYAPMKYQGLGIPHPFASQLFHHLDMLLRHPANSTQTGKYLQAVMESHQLETGTSFGLFQQVYENTAILASDTWVKRVWRQLDHLDIFLSMDITPLRLRSKHDRFIMEVFMDLGVDQQTLKWLNWCRMYLGVVTVSDLVTADGRYLRNSILQGYRDFQFLSVYEWPRTARPGASHWRSWKECLTEALLTPSSTLRRPLKHWDDSIAEWRWLYSPSQELLFHRHNMSWVVYQRLATTRHTKRSQSTFVRLPPHCWNVPLPPDVLRATTEQIHTTDRIILTGVGEPAPGTSLATLPSILNQWHKLSQQATPYLGWVPDEIRIFGSEKALFEALMNDELCVISDGSYLAPLGTSATTLTTRHGTDRIVILTQTPGQTDDQCSYRSELCGMYVGIMVADWLVITWGPHDQRRQSRPTVYFGSDGLSALRRAFGNYHIKATDHHFDLLSAVRSYRRTIAFHCQFRHIQAHRDKEVAWENLTWWEQMNCEVDVLAGEYRESLLLDGIDSSPNPRFFTEPSALFIGGMKQSKLDRAFIQEVVAMPTLRSRWGKCHWDENIEEEVAWTQMGTAMRSLRSSLQRWTTKNVVGMCGVGKFMKKWGYSSDPRCPLCSFPEETAEHVPRCTDKRAAAEWQNQMEVLDHWFTSNRTSPLIASSLFHLLSLVRSPSEDPIVAADPRYQPAVDSQVRIGSQGLLEGRLSRLWLPLQAEYFQEIGSPRSPNTWASQLSTQLLLIGHSMWTHRNSIRHSDDGVQNRDLSAQVNQGIIAQFELGLDNLPRRYHQYMEAGLHRVLARPLVARRDWLKLVSAKRRATTRGNTPQRRIWHEFIDKCTVVTPSPSTR